MAIGQELREFCKFLYEASIMFAFVFGTAGMGTYLIMSWVLPFQ